MVEKMVLETKVYDYLENEGIPKRSDEVALAIQENPLDVLKSLRTLVGQRKITHSISRDETNQINTPIYFL